MPHQTKLKCYIGIDPGVKTGFALYEKGSGKLMIVESMPIHRAMSVTGKLAVALKATVRVEDARQARFFRKGDAHRLRGAGSAMRDAKIWEDFLTSLGVDFEMVRPRKELTKLTAAKFRQVTGFKGITNEHGRDAAMLVYGY